jgi:glycerophosphoryl diester phosphodiesterase
MRAFALLLAALTAMAADIPVHGHRGARSVLPENTIPAFEYAIAQGADWIELDLWVTRDNKVVVTHDPEMNAAYCRGPKGAERAVRRMTLDELKRWDCGAAANPAYPRQKAVPGTRVPTLDEALALAPKGSFRFNIEIKNLPNRPELAPPVEEYARLVVDTIRRHKLDSRVMIQSFDWRLLHAVAKLAPDWPRTALFPVPGKPLDMGYVEIAREANVKAVSAHYDTVTPEKVKRAHDAGLKVVAWTANTPDVWERLVAAGVDEIITDDPAGLLAWLRERKLHR